jgi:hypothetical protein
MEWNEISGGSPGFNELNFLNGLNDLNQGDGQSLFRYFAKNPNVRGHEAFAACSR